MTYAEPAIPSAAPLGAAKVRARRRFRLVPTLPLAMLLLFVLAGVFAPVLTPHDPVKNNLADSLIPPAFIEGGQAEYLLGTDGFGRDVFTRLLFGARVSLMVAGLSLTIAVLIGTSVGVIAGYFGGAVDATLMRFVDVLLTMPTLLFALVLSIVVGASLQNVVLVLGFLIWPSIARLIRGETLLLRKRDFVRYAGAIGVPRYRILLRHVVPNVLPTLLVATTLEVANVIMTEASLSFLGAGVPPPTPSWGVMIDEGRALLATGWWIALFPGIAITVVVLSCNAVGDWLSDKFDPRAQGR